VFVDYLAISHLQLIFLQYKRLKDEGLIEQDILFRCDEYGFFLYWQADGKVKVLNANNNNKKEEETMTYN
jgi:hypothetical protein